MADLDNLKQLVEQFSEKEIQELTLQKKIVNAVEDMSADQINQLPLLYRLEVKKALQDNDHDDKAASIHT
jgi:hypothetical protein